MDADAKKTALRMIPYGIYVLTADDRKGAMGAATVNWVTQSSFNPPLVVVGVKADFGAYAVLKSAGKFTLNMLGKDHKGLAFAFFKPAKIEDGQLSGQGFMRGGNGAPILDAAIGAVECRSPDRRAGRPPHRCRRGDRGVSAPSAGRPTRCGDPGDEGPGRYGLLRRLGVGWRAVYLCHGRPSTLPRVKYPKASWVAGPSPAMTP